MTIIKTNTLPNSVEKSIKNLKKLKFSYHKLRKKYILPYHL